MKAKIKETREIIEILGISKEYGTVSYIDHLSNLRQQDFCDGAIELIDGLESDRKVINWEQRRYELAKDFMSAMIASPTYKYCKALEYDVNKPLREHQDGLAKNAIIYTDRLIAELRKPNPDDEFSSIVEQAPNLHKALEEIVSLPIPEPMTWKAFSDRVRNIALSAIGKCK